MQIIKKIDNHGNTDSSTGIIEANDTHAKLTILNPIPVDPDVEDHYFIIYSFKKYCEDHSLTSEVDYVLPY